MRPLKLMCGPKYPYSGAVFGMMLMAQMACTSVPMISPENSVVKGIPSVAPFIVVGLINSVTDLNRPIKITKDNAPQAMRLIKQHLFCKFCYSCSGEIKLSILK
jgi:hypothetical protein